MDGEVLPASWFGENLVPFRLLRARTPDGKRLYENWYRREINRSVRIYVEWREHWFDRCNRWRCGQSSCAWLVKVYSILRKDELREGKKSIRWIRGWFSRLRFVFDVSAFFCKARRCAKAMKRESCRLAYQDRNRNLSVRIVSLDLSLFEYLLWAFDSRILRYYGKFVRVDSERERRKRSFSERERSDSSLTEKSVWISRR